MNKKFNVILDTREQTPWTLTDSDYIESIIVTKLDTGDYAIEGLEDKLCIERKASVSEIAKNIFESRFTDELIRMQDYPHKYIICEFSYDDILNYPYKSGFRRDVIKRIKVKGPLLIKKLMDLTLKYNVHLLFCGSPLGAKSAAVSIMKLINEKYNVK